ncbi:lactate dehydrogenase [Mediterraneibacter sp. NSJ-55]|uniref:Lactate dehydrogenase n=1 Tax=Mediterraneibacter hominis TaxID=2763054 RepID=A0A923LL09_9FIRM|nr:D-isomer specific 2-hydroxyacid dehydrogenase family protein [Mediterraneibacter hominis]MBC5689874.1 lactate dehydrogenase [Mediterraneibacter hominis]
MKIFIYAMREFDELDVAEKLKKEYGIDFEWSAQYPTLENAHLAQGCDAVSTTPCEMGAEILERFHSLGVKYITTRSIGYDHIDLKRAGELGIRVSNTKYDPDGVSNYTVMLILMCLRNMLYILKCAEVQDYTLRKKIGKDLASCTVGVIGTGQIGANVVRNLSGFGCKILAYDIYEKEYLPCEYVPLEELYEKSDIITIHTPATPESHHMINAQTIAHMKKGAMLVNCARGSMIDTDALIEGLESGQIGGAALDVLEKEDGLYYYNRMGDVIENRTMAILRSFPNVILSPHTAFYTDKDVENMMRYNFDSLYRFENGLENPLEVKLPAK